MTPNKIIHYAKRAEDLKKILELYKFQNGIAPIDQMTITLKKGRLTKSVSFNYAGDIEAILQTFRDISDNIQKDLDNIKEVTGE